MAQQLVLQMQDHPAVMRQVSLVSLAAQLLNQSSGAHCMAFYTAHCAVKIQDSMSAAVWQEMHAQGCRFALKVSMKPTAALSMMEHAMPAR